MGLDFFQKLHDSPQEISYISSYKSEDYDIKRFMLPDIKSIQNAKVLRFGLEGRFYKRNCGMINSHSEKDFRNFLSKEDG